MESFQAPQAVVLILFPFSLHSTSLTRCNSTAKWVQLNFERPGKQYDSTSTTITLITQIDIAHQEAKAIQPIFNNLLSHTYKYYTTRDRKKYFKKTKVICSFFRIFTGREGWGSKCLQAYGLLVKQFTAGSRRLDDWVHGS